MENLIKVSEIFRSIDGEGIRSGYPVTFIRLYGCNLKCSYCDSPYATTDGDYMLMSISDIIEHVDYFGLHRITLTGGEPLACDQCYELVTELTDAGYEVNIETNGSLSILPYVDMKNVIITMDYKCPSSDMEDRMNRLNLPVLRSTDVLKFVVGSKIDLSTMLAVVNEYDITANIFVSPVFGEIDPKEIVDFLICNDIENVRVQLQLHKIIWDPNMRGV